MLKIHHSTGLMANVFTHYCYDCQSFEEVVRDVAGVKNRNYKNSVYKIIRPNNKPVYIAAECATSLHTLYKVMKNRHLSEGKLLS